MIPFIDKPLVDITSDEWSTWRDSLAAGSVEEVKSLCAALEYADGVPTTQSQRVALGLLFALETGTHAGEIFSLRATNVDYKNRVAHLPLRAYADRGYFNAPQIKG
jgi:integrase